MPSDQQRIAVIPTRHMSHSPATTTPGQPHAQGSAPLAHTRRATGVGRSAVPSPCRGRGGCRRLRAHTASARPCCGLRTEAWEKGPLARSAVGSTGLRHARRRFPSVPRE
jgi:hypothetical protein